ncbi:hypothetical protein EXIGLDRAFT_108231 [Exidia glandulosa HHB12029]|uniref:Zn(2)-C6 fungal-type domain-containing protein n=1 Tax=Exidia glandulosa HHB12029 TaxID=1314781 RepID=A0A165GRB2_EXIGL|nr:hypothetical protein EXIGLDRAFT_108231 [Exidia glandulosa HHB12029]
MHIMTTTAARTGDAPAARRRTAETRDKGTTSSCAECKRLRLRCDKKIPCITCTRRGCASICPHETLVKGVVQGKRLVLTTSRQLYDKIDAMRKRVVELQDAIERMDDKKEVRIASLSSAQEDGLPELVGKLALEHEVFFGPHAASELFFFYDSSPPTPSWGNAKPRRCILSQFMARRLAMPGVVDVAQLFRVLPEEEIVRSSLAYFFENVSWIFGAVSQNRVNTLADAYYKGDLCPLTEAFGRQRRNYAVLVMSVAVALVLDPHVEAVPDAHHYYTLASVALAYDEALENPDLDAIWTLHLMAWFMHLDGNPESMSRAYSLAGLASRLCQNLGLHRDDAGWNLPSEAKQERRQLVWDVLWHDLCLAKTLGRPSAFSLHHFDARLPYDTEAYLDDEGVWKQSFAAWNHCFASAVMHRVHAEAFGAGSVTRDTVMDSKPRRMDHQ